VNVKAYADLASMSEDDRIRVIGETAAAGNMIGVALEKDEAKIARYIRKVTTRHPNVVLVKRAPGLTSATVLLQFGPRPQ
jgi:hypothetical protein